MMDPNATSFYPSAIWDELSVDPKLDIGSACEHYMNNIHVEAFSNRTFKQDGNENAISKIKLSNPPNPILQHLPVNEKVKNIEVNRMPNVYFIDSLTIVDIKENVKLEKK